jgi:SPP1 gp7 family putative phage head morphogenesis protein
MPELTLQARPFDEAVHYFRSKGMRLSPEGWRDVWAAENVRAFTVARVTAMDVLEDIRGAVDQAIEKGVTLTRFRAELIETLARKGWMKAPGIEPTAEAPLVPWRLDTIYRNNVQSAYMAGRYKQMVENARRRPFWLYDAVDDRRTRPSHAVHDGVVRRFDHPFWDTWYPPNGHRCRCSVRALSARQMQRRGLEEETQGTSWKPDEGFDYNPGREFWQPDLTKYSPEGRRILQGAGAAHPNDMPALAERLTRIKDGFKETGMPASARPIRLTEDRQTRFNAWARYRTGEIGIRPAIWREIRAALKKGEAERAQLDALKTLMHEFGHQMGYEIDTQRYERDQAYYAITQTVNDVWARDHTAHLLKALGLRHSLRETERLKRFHPSGYQPWVEKFRHIMRAAGVSEAEEKILVTELNLTAPTQEFSERIWQILQQKKPHLTPRGDFGDMLVKDDRFQWLLEEVSR